jgi:hypothetical protein
MALLSLGIAHMFFTMWIGGAWRLVRPVSELSFIPDGAAGIIALVLLGGGLYTGFLLLFINDYRKYYQGLLIAAGSVVVTLALAALGIGLPSMRPSLLNVGAFLLGTVLAFAVETAQFDGFDVNGDLRYIDFAESELGHARSQDGESLNFTLASYGLVAMIVTLVLAGNVLNVLVALPSVGALQVGHAVVSGAFLFFMGSFVRLNLEDKAASDTQFEILGPTQSGKTYSILALYLEAKSNDSYDITDMGGEMTTLVEEHAQMADARGGGPDASLDWSIDNTLPDRTYQLSFEIQKNDAVPTQKVGFDTVDHAGELLEDISYGLISTEAATDGGQDTTDEEDEQEEGDELFSNGFDVDDSSDTDAGDETGEDEQSFRDRVEHIRESRANPEESVDTVDEEDSFDGTTSGFDDDSSFEDDSSFDDGGFDSSSQTEDEQDSAADVDDIEADEPTEPERETASEETGQSSPAAQENTTVGERPKSNFPSASSSSADAPTDDETAESEADQEASDEGFVRPSTKNDDTKAGLEQDDAIDIVVRNINHSDRLVMLLDTERFLGGEPAGDGSQSMEISNLNRIRKNAPVDKSDITLVATKADLLIEEWQEERGYTAGPSESDQRWKDFSDWVSAEYEKNDLVGGFMSTLGTSKVYPVYFETEMREGSLEPKPGENGGLQPYGYDQALDAIIRDN